MNSAPNYADGTLLNKYGTPVQPGSNIPDADVPDDGQIFWWLLAPQHWR